MTNTDLFPSVTAEMSEIQSFYNGSTVFLTGATGFIGSLILEKLLRTCLGVKRVYILIREKKGKTPEDRFNELFDGPLFELIKNRFPDYLGKVTLVVGDSALPNMGIGEQDLELLKNNVDIIIHSAATVRLDELLRTAVQINICALQYMIKLSKEMKNIKSFVHISTAYSNCAGRKVVEEVFYKQPYTGDQLVRLVDNLDDDTIKRITPSLLNEFSNTYTLTKAVAEYEIFTHGKGLPIGIIRPSMITSTETEPIPGWINNIYGPTGVSTAIGIGLMRVMLADPNETADIVPGDYVAHAALACAWDIHNKWKEHKANDNTTTRDNDGGLKTDSFSSPIYNYVSSNTNRLTWMESANYHISHAKNIPSEKTIWPIMVWITPNKYKYLILIFLLHIIPGYIVDFIAKIMGRKPILMDGYRKLHKFTNVIANFSCRSWKFSEENTRSLLSKMSESDLSNFRFDIAKLNWSAYIQNINKGVRIYIFKDPLDTVPQGIKHHRKLYAAYYTLLTFLTALFASIIYGLYLLCFK